MWDCVDCDFSLSGLTVTLVTMSQQRIQIMILVFMSVSGLVENPMHEDSDPKENPVYEDSDPKLKVSETEDLTFACNAGGLQLEAMDSLYYFHQIVKLDPEPEILATTTPVQEPFVSKFVKQEWYRRYKVLPSQTSMWLNLTIFDVHYLTRYEKYRCQLFYYPNGTERSLHTDLEFGKTAMKVPGFHFHLIVQKGLAFTCEWDMLLRDSQLQQVNMSFWQVSTENNKELLVASSTLDETNSSAGSVCDSVFNVSRRVWVLRCYLDSVVSVATGTYQCRVTVGKKTVVSQNVTVTPENHGCKLDNRDMDEITVTPKNHGCKLDNRDMDEIDYLDVPAWIHAVDVILGIVVTSAFLLIVLGVLRYVKSIRSADNHLAGVDSALFGQRETAV